MFFCIFDCPNYPFFISCNDFLRFSFCLADSYTFKTCSFWLNICSTHIPVLYFSHCLTCSTSSLSCDCKSPYLALDGALKLFFLTKQINMPSQFFFCGEISDLFYAVFHLQNLYLHVPLSFCVGF